MFCYTMYYVLHNALCFAANILRMYQLFLIHPQYGVSLQHQSLTTLNVPVLLPPSSFSM
jgi:hypothetical protein